MEDAPPPLHSPPKPASTIYLSKFYAPARLFFFFFFLTRVVKRLTTFEAPQSSKASETECVGGRNTCKDPFITECLNVLITSDILDVIYSAALVIN